MALLEATVPLTPAGGGGLCIAAAALQPADIIVSTTTNWKSDAIRIATVSAVSHASLYIGNGMVIEAIAPAVTQRSLDVALADDALAVAYRHPAMSPDIAARVVAFAEKQAADKAAYSLVGALASQTPLCVIDGERSSTFFCSQLVLRAYRAAGLPLTSIPAGCVTPGIVVLIAQWRLKYVGHLKGNPSLFSVIAP